MEYEKDEIINSSYWTLKSSTATYLGMGILTEEYSVIEANLEIHLDTILVDFIHEKGGGNEKGTSFCRNAILHSFKVDANIEI